MEHVVKGSLVDKYRFLAGEGGGTSLLNFNYFFFTVILSDDYVFVSFLRQVQAQKGWKQVVKKR